MAKRKKTGTTASRHAQKAARSAARGRAAARGRKGASSPSRSTSARAAGRKKTASPAKKAAKPAAKAVKKAVAKKAVAKKTVAKKAVKRAAPKTAAPTRAKTTRAASKPTAAATRPAPSTPKAARAAAIREKASPRKSAGNIERETTRHSEPTSDRPSIPSSLTVDRNASQARTGSRDLRQQIKNHPESGPAMTAGDVDADWEQAYSSGDEAPGGDNPTPDQDRVDDIGRALGVEYQEGEELKGADKITERDRHRWELDPASAEDYPEHET